MLHKKLCAAKVARKRAEEDLKLLCNRIGLLKMEEGKVSFYMKYPSVYHQWLIDVFLNNRRWSKRLTRQGSERVRSWIRDREMSWPNRLKMIACASNKWTRLWNAKWIVQRSKWPMRLFRIANSLHNRGRNKQLRKPKCRSRRVGRWTRSSVQMKSNVRVTWSPWSCSKSNKQPNSVSSTSWSARTAPVSRSKRSWPVRLVSNLPMNRMSLAWNAKSSSSSIDWRIRNC